MPICSICGEEYPMEGHDERDCLIAQLTALQKRLAEAEDHIRWCYDEAKGKKISFNERQERYEAIQAFLAGQTSEYVAVRRDLFLSYTIFFVGYSLKDLDIILPLDKIAHEGIKSRHYLLSRRGARNAVEKKRLSFDRQIDIVEYIDYFDFHNHVETFLEGMLVASNNRQALQRVRRSLRANIYVYYAPDDEEDDLFVWHYVFREGAITWSVEAQRSQWDRLKESIEKGLPVTDYLVFLMTPSALALPEVTKIVTLVVQTAVISGVHVVFLAVGFSGRPAFLADLTPSSPMFLLNVGFSEADLEPFRKYLAETIKGGFRHR